MGIEHLSETVFLRRKDYAAMESWTKIHAIDIVVNVICFILMWGISLEMGMCSCCLLKFCFSITLELQIVKD
jgi:hypothetical protein